MNKCSGFTLIEVLVAMLVLAFGLLGLAGVQVISLKNNLSSYNRSQATLLANDLVDRIRSNVYDKATYTSIVPSNAHAKENCLKTNGCTGVEMAENDLYEWNCSVAGVCERNMPPIATTLPNGQGIVCLDGTPYDGVSAASLDSAMCDGVGSAYVIKIWWDDNRSGAASQRFVVSFQLL
jgi:type IV pilus assembly protein PilV